MSQIKYDGMSETLSILTSKFHQLGVRYFKAENPNGITVIINSATGVKQRYYADYATFLSEQGFQVFTYDYCGIGESKKKSLFKTDASILEWSQVDYSAVVKHAKETFPHNALVAIGHSIGGQILGMTDESKRVDTFMMVAAQTPYWKKFQTKMKPKLWLFWYVTIPFFTGVFRFFPASKLGLFEDLPKSAALQWARWAKTKNYLFDENPSLKKQFEDLDQPAKVYSFSDDSIAPIAAVKDLLQFYPNLKIDHQHIQPEDLAISDIGHFGFFKKRFQNTLWAESVEWLKKNVRKRQRSAA